MNNDNITNALQDLIIRLQDAEKGYKEIEKATSNVSLKQWMQKYATERHNMHRELESLSKLFGDKAEVKTSFLGELHRMFIDLKLNNTEEDFTYIATEIDRGASKLIEDYEYVLSNVEMPSNVVSTLQAQKATIEVELNEINRLKEEFETVDSI